MVRVSNQNAVSLCSSHVLSLLAKRSKDGQGVAPVRVVSIGARTMAKSPSIPTPANPWDYAGRWSENPKSSPKFRAGCFLGRSKVGARRSGFEKPVVQWVQTY